MFLTHTQLAQSETSCRKCGVILSWSYWERAWERNRWETHSKLAKLLDLCQKCRKKLLNWWAVHGKRLPKMKRNRNKSCREADDHPDCDEASWTLRVWSWEGREAPVGAESHSVLAPSHPWVPHPTIDSFLAVLLKVKTQSCAMGVSAGWAKHTLPFLVRVFSPAIEGNLINMH